MDMLSPVPTARNIVPDAPVRQRSVSRIPGIGDKEVDALRTKLDLDPIELNTIVTVVGMVVAIVALIQSSVSKDSNPVQLVIAALCSLYGLYVLNYMRMKISNNKREDDINRLSSQLMIWIGIGVTCVALALALIDVLVTAEWKLVVQLGLLALSLVTILLRHFLNLYRMKRSVTALPSAVSLASLPARQTQIV